ncbi:TlyA family RNA methyltransferase [Hyphococcus sp.]|uniref:TlyA family RNA methyltransferase n=1 Tax=Hyphococcus sp. TaxID=2038636 RepID=UPI003CCC1D41
MKSKNIFAPALQSYYNRLTGVAVNLMRLDQTLVLRRLAASRARAQALIDAGRVRVNGAVALKASVKISDDANITVEGDLHAFVSRGGLKLEAALAEMSINVAGLTCLDLGASTGGFTDVLLQNGAAKVYAVDVGHGQLHEKIRKDSRVVNLEKTHAYDLSPALVPEQVDFIVCDVSFISLKKALPHALTFAAPHAGFIALIKPQFEVGPAGVGKGGLVREDLARQTADNLRDWVEDLAGWRVAGLIESPIKGGDGNMEFLIGATKTS